MVFDDDEERAEQGCKLVAEALRSEAVYAPCSEDGRVPEADRLFLEQWVERRATFGREAQ